ncbi:hypothetical protein JL722_14409 [Aureococcus anophagefferens]|nr:hypothetical protein JL722_14409 [Aureococcus anophagefferens]
MSDDRFADATARLVAQDPSLTSLSLATRKDIPDAVLAALAASDHCRTAHLEMTAFDDGRCEALREFGSLAGAPGSSRRWPRAGAATGGYCAHCHGNGVDDAAAAALAPLLAAAGVREVYLGKNPSATPRAPRWRRSRAAPRPRKLSLLGNRVGDAGAASFAAAVARDPPLEQLNLSHNDLSDAGLLAMIRRRANGTLRKLDVGVNRRCSDGAKRALRLLFDPSAVAARRFVAGALPLLLAHAARRRRALAAASGACRCPPRHPRPRAARPDGPRRG